MATLGLEQPNSGQTRNQTPVRYWLYSVCILIVAIMLVGGATRLTESGLSITEWEPISGVVPPLNEQSWMDEFYKYQQIPEYRLKNLGMSLDEFKNIYWWEWWHRILARLVGVVFIVPFVIFLVSGRLERRLIPHLVVILALGGLQGLVGWWMVASGLVNRVDVSHYRLVVHLSLACLILAYTLRIAYGLKQPVHTRSASPTLRREALLILLLIFLQIMLGGLVAGLNAGMTYNTWPLMDGKLVPNGLFVIDPVWKNFFENVLTVQFQHRIVAYLIVILSLLHFVHCFLGSGKQFRRSAFVVFAFTLAQAVLGITTLIAFDRIELALAHQTLAVIILISCVRHYASMAIGTANSPASSTLQTDQR